MTARATLGRLGAAAILFASAVAFSPPSRAAAPVIWDTPAGRLTPAQLRDRAAKAEQAGDWEAALTAYLDLPAAERVGPATRG
ncbi:MAG TPA: hypothetical protein VH092_07595, partial [Urbifossiella sp.]|nr:hypothetical protein [Urbifossiella sp.]